MTYTYIFTYCLYITALYIIYFYIYIYIYIYLYIYKYLTRIPPAFQSGFPALDSHLPCPTVKNPPGSSRRPLPNDGSRSAPVFRLDDGCGWMSSKNDTYIARSDRINKQTIVSLGVNKGSLRVGIV